MLMRRCFLVTLCVIWLAAGMAAAQTDRSYPEVGPGLEYICHRIGDVPWAMYVIKVDRSRDDFKLTTTLGQGTIYGLSRLSQHIAALPAELGRPVAAVNGDFYWLREGLYQGDPTGLQIVEGELVSAPTGVSFWVDPSGELRMGKVESELRVTWPNGTEAPIGLNEERKDNAAVLYTPTLGESTRTTGGREFVLEQVYEGYWLPISAGETYTARVREIRDEGNTPLAPDIMVLSLGPDLPGREPFVRKGDILRIHTTTSPDLRGVDVAIGGGPILVSGGNVGEWHEPQPRHPRTAIGWNDKHMFLAVVDGRQADLSSGMSFPELATLMQKWGCTEAMNLDGGGSSTIWLGDRVMNVPSDGRERGIANALILLRTKSEASASE